MLPYILIGIAIAIVLLIVVIGTRSPTFRITRSTTISAPPSVVFAQVNDFHNWDGWSPWAKLDPSMKTTYEGPAAGTGASYHWIGNSKVGEGRMTIVESRPAEVVRIKLEFLKPFKATNEAQFSFRPKGSDTLVEWSMTGTKNFMFKFMHMIMNMDKMLGAQFEKGLAQMKAVAESKTQA